MTAKIILPIIPKTELVDGAYYHGSCRNASIARWNAAEQQFYHWRNKFGWYVETISAPEDEQYYDVFVATSLIETDKVAKEIPFNRDYKGEIR